MNAKRNTSCYQQYLYDFLKYDISVVCPNCDSKALVKTNGYILNKDEVASIKMSCLHCGTAKEFSKKPVIDFESTRLWSQRPKPTIVLGIPKDPFFQLPLWYVASCVGEQLWAYSTEHLVFLEQFIGAKLRQRSLEGIVNRSIGSRLPTWMTSKKNRDTVLRTLSSLKEK